MYIYDNVPNIIFRYFKNVLVRNTYIIHNNEIVVFKKSVFILAKQDVIDYIHNRYILFECIGVAKLSEP